MKLSIKAKMTSLNRAIKRHYKAAVKRLQKALTISGSRYKLAPAPNQPSTVDDHNLLPLLYEHEAVKRASVPTMFDQDLFLDLLFLGRTDDLLELNIHLTLLFKKEEEGTGNESGSSVMSNEQQPRGRIGLLPSFSMLFKSCSMEAMGPVVSCSFRPMCTDYLSMIKVKQSYN
jgi:hypothetical protein